MKKPSICNWGRVPYQVFGRLCLGVFLASILPLQSATFTVTSTNDSGEGSLRQAILDANTNVGPDLITFAIASTNLIIAPTNALPAITDPLTIDGSTQPGFTNRAIIELNGQDAGAGSDGLRIQTSNCVIRGLVINRFNGDGIEITNFGFNQIQGNVIGADVLVSNDLGNNGSGIWLFNSANNLIGGTNFSDRNYIAGNNQNGILVSGSGSTNNLIQGNFIGINSDLDIPLGNTSHGISLQSSANRMGGIFAGEANVIAHSAAGDGVFVSSGTNNAIRGNSIFSNNGLAIDLGINGITANDLNDSDGGANRLQNFPILTAAVLSLTNTSVEGSLTSESNKSCSLDFFASPVPDPSGNGEASFYLGTIEVITGSTGKVSFSATFPASTDHGFISATATDAFGNTSELSPALRAFSTAPGVTIPVVNTNDSGPGSLRQAIIDANAANTADLIIFNLPSDSLTISLSSPLPSIIDPLVLDGATQPGYSNAPLIELNGENAGAGADGIQIVTSNSVIRGLVINRFAGDGIEITNFGFNRIQGNYIGLDSMGLVALSNQGNGILIRNSSDNLIGGTNLLEGNYISGNRWGVQISSVQNTNLAPSSRNQMLGNFIGLNRDDASVRNVSDGVIITWSPSNQIGGSTPQTRNIISGNGSSGIFINGHPGIVSLGLSNQIQGNLIGTDRSGILPRPNGSDGIRVAYARKTVIGGNQFGEGNVISGNGGDGLEILSEANETVVWGNRIGVDISGMLDLGNGGHGITISTSSNLIGGVLPGNANTVAFSRTGDGVYIAQGTGTAIRGNQIFNNAGLGIDLDPNGFTTNDLNDADSGANLRQNFPVLTSALFSSNTMVQARLNSRPNASYEIDVYANSVVDISSYGEAEIYLGSFSVATDAAGNADFTAAVGEGRGLPFISATATDAAGNTSELSRNIRGHSLLAGSIFVVSNANDSGPGSLREAISNANNTLTTDTITFDLPPGNHRIALTTSLPPVLDPVIIDGTTQPGYSNAPLIELNGMNAGANVSGLRLQTTNCVIRGLVINQFSSNGVQIISNGFHRVEGCIIGLDPTGTIDLGNTNHGIFINNSANNIIGGDSPNLGNLVAGNDADGLHITGTNATNNMIQGNLIGLGRGTNNVGNGGNGIFIGSASNTIGGTNLLARNVISHNGLPIFFVNSSDGIELSTNAHRNSIIGNFIGTDVAGKSVRPNMGSGILFVSASSNRIGGLLSGEGNLIGGNAVHGISIDRNSTGNVFYGNLIGTDSTTRTLVLGNTNHNVSISGSGNVLGGVLPGQDNVIAFSIRGSGVVVAFGEGNSIRGNSIFDNDIPPFSGPSIFNQRLGIDLGDNGITTNDVADADSGPNRLQNFPILTSAVITETNTLIEGSLNSAPNTVFVIDLYSDYVNRIGGPPLHGEGIFYLGSFEVLTDGGGNATFSTAVGGRVQTRYLSATATDPFGNTSEFSQTIYVGTVVPPARFTVINTNDFGSGSLRAALSNASQTITAGTNDVAFNIPGEGPHLISVRDNLPINYHPVNIDGYSQPGASRNTLSTGNNAVIKIQLDGFGTSNFPALFLWGSNSVVQGLSITRFNGGIFARGASNLVVGNFLGLAPDGVTVGGNRFAGVSIFSFGWDRIGGPAPGDRNVISGNTSVGIEAIVFSSTAPVVIQGNYVGTDASGTLARPNLTGIYINAFDVLVGGTMDEGNLISGNLGAGVEVRSRNRTRILGNRIGTDALGITNLGNGGAGILLTTSDNQIGSTNLGEGNLIAFNASDGVTISGGTNNLIRGNRIFSNAGLGIDVGTDGVLSNDFGDVDAGVNQSQNYPILTSASGSGSVLVVAGTLNSSSNTTFALDFYSSPQCDPSGNGEGQFYLGSRSVSTDASGNATFDFGFPSVPPAQFITATATDPNGNTSEFSPCAQVSEAPRRLEISYQNGSAIISWTSSPTTPATELQSTDSLTPPIIWTAVPATAIINRGGTYEHVVTEPGFYRLAPAATPAGP